MTRSSMDSCYSYDCPMTLSASSSSCSASVKISVRHHNNRKGTIASDVARILDPSYSPPSSPRRTSSVLISAYVDHHGDMHDPDYRDFPAVSSAIVDDEDSEESVVMAQWAPAEYANERKRRLTEASANSHYYKQYTAPVERSRSISPSSPCSSSPYSLYSHLTTEQDIESTTSLPHLTVDSYEADTELTRTTSTPSVVVAAPPKQRNHHSLKRQWQAVSLRVRFGMFRAGKRWGMV